MLLLLMLIAEPAVPGTFEGPPLIPGPLETGYDANLGAKADAFDRQIHQIMTVSLGWGLEAYVSDPAKRALIDGFFASGAADFRAHTGKHPYEAVDAFGEHGDLGMFGGVQAAGDAFRYAVLRDGGAPQDQVAVARNNVIRALDGLYWFHHITGQPGVVARGLQRIIPEAGDPPVPGDVPELIPLRDAQGNPLPEMKDRAVGRADFSGELPFLIWIDDTSKDQLTGYVFALGVFYDLLRGDPNIPQDKVDRLLAIARAIARKLREKVEINGQMVDLVIRDADGRPTRFHDIAAEEPLPGLVTSEAASGFNALMALGMMRTFYHMTGDQDIYDYYFDELIVKRDYIGSIERSISATYVGNITNYSNINMMFVSAYNVLRYENDPATAQRIRLALQNNVYNPGLDRQAKGLKQSLFDFIAAAFQPSGGSGAEAVRDGLQSLVEHRSPPYWNELVENCDAAEIASLNCTASDGTPLTLSPDPGRGGALVAIDVVPMRLRPPNNYMWRSDPHVVNGGDADAVRLNPGGDFHAVYWMGRFLRVESGPLGNVSPLAKPAAAVETSDESSCACSSSEQQNASPVYSLTALLFLVSLRVGAARRKI